MGKLDTLGTSRGRSASGLAEATHAKRHNTEYETASSTLRPKATSSTLGVGVYHQTKAFVPRGKPPIGKPPHFAARPFSAPPDPRIAIAERREQRARALQQWERETSRPPSEIPVPMPGSRPQSAIERRPRTLSSPPRPEDYKMYIGREHVPMPPPPLLF